MTLTILDARRSGTQSRDAIPNPPVPADAVEPKSYDKASPHQVALAWWWGFALGFARLWRRWTPSIEMRERRG